MAKKEKRSTIIPKIAAETKESKTSFISKEAATLKNQVESDSDDAHVLMSIKYLQHDFQCFSDWESKEMKAFWGFNKKLHDHTWKQIYQTASTKKGLAYDKISYDKYPESDFKKELSKDHTLFELRVTDKARVHGFRIKGIFYLCWLDRNHEICG
ncbi:MAG: MAG6450 family protein [Bacteroidales bacterium]